MKILGDIQIPLLRELFSHLGEVASYTGRTISPEQLEGVDVLLVRSTVNVDKALLENTSVKFVGTCTIGTDHLDKDYLDQQNIAWANAAGCNADSVVQYVMSVMAQLAPKWKQSTVGIIACGNIGGRVYRRLRALDVECRCYDPFLSSADIPELTTLEDVLQSDVVISHAPLTKDGLHPTQHMLGEREFQQLRPDSVLISAGRGAVLDNKALLKRLTSKKTFSVALDVWENEPNILSDLINHVDIATPHIAGYSLDGRENGSVMIFQALCQHFELSSEVDFTRVVNRGRAELALTEDDVSEEEAFNQLLLAAYPVMEDDGRLRSWKLSGKSLAEYFDYLRRNYPERREYAHFIMPDWVQQAPFKEWLDILMDP